VALTRVIITRVSARQAAGTPPEITICATVSGSSIWDLRVGAVRFKILTETGEVGPHPVGRANMEKVRDMATMVTLGSLLARIEGAVVAVVVVVLGRAPPLRTEVTTEAALEGTQSHPPLIIIETTTDKALVTRGTGLALPPLHHQGSTFARRRVCSQLGRTSTKITTLL